MAAEYAEYARQLVSQAPPFTDAQRARLARLLASGKAAS